VERNVPATIHCLRAWGALWDHIHEHDVPAGGFLLHAYGGPAEMVEEFVKRGAYFSFSGYFLHERKSRQRDVFRGIPIDRLLVETDAPDMLPPHGSGASFLKVSGTGELLNSPLNLELNYRGLAEIRGMRVEELRGQVEENFRRLFGG
jgi:TatD DNase family protein